MKKLIKIEAIEEVTYCDACLKEISKDTLQYRCMNCGKDLCCDCRTHVQLNLDYHLSCNLCPECIQKLTVKDVENLIKDYRKR